MRWRPFLLLLGFNLGLQAVLATVNGALAPWSIHLHLDVLYLMVAALYLPATPAFIAVLLQGFLVDAWWPISEGQVPTIYGAVFLVLLGLRGGMRRDHPGQVALVAVLCNLAILLVLALWMIPPASPGAAYALRISFDGLISTLVLLLILPRFLQGARLLFRLAGEDLLAQPLPR